MSGGSLSCAVVALLVDRCVDFALASPRVIERGFVFGVVVGCIVFRAPGSCSVFAYLAMRRGRHLVHRCVDFALARPRMIEGESVFGDVVN